MFWGLVRIANGAVFLSRGKGKLFSWRVNPSSPALISMRLRGDKMSSEVTGSNLTEEKIRHYKVTAWVVTIAIFFNWCLARLCAE